MREDLVAAQRRRGGRRRAWSASSSTPTSPTCSRSRRAGSRPDRACVEVGPDALTYRARCAARPHDDGHRDRRPVVTPGSVTYQVVVPARGEWSACLSVRAIGRTAGASRRATGAANRSTRPPRPGGCARWRLASPSVSTPRRGAGGDPAREQPGPRRAADPRPGPPGRRVVAAGAPWFMALFGRDSLLTSWMALPLDQQLAPRHAADPRPVPGRARRTRSPRNSRAGSCTRSGSGGRRRSRWAAAAPTTGRPTPRRCSSRCSASCTAGACPTPRCSTLLPAADRALAWIEEYGDLDGDGFVEYRGRPTAGWSTRAGRTPSTASTTRPAGSGRRRSRWPRCRPTCYAAYRARARDRRRRVGDPATADGCRGAGRAAQGGVQRAVLAAGPRVVRRRAGPRQAARSTRWPRTWATACGPGSSTTTRRRRWPRTCVAPAAVDRLRGAHAGHARWAPTTR